MKNQIAQTNCFANAVISIELDTRARLLAARLRLTRSKLMARALADFIDRLESDPARLESEAQHGQPA